MAISRTDAAHLLRRTGYVVTTAAIDRTAAATDWTAAVDQVLDVATPVQPALPAKYTNAAEDDWARRTALVQWWMEIMRTTADPLTEKMAMFFHGHHFVSGRMKGTPAPLVLAQLQLFRANALGDYHELAQRVAVDPFMLQFLDNGVNRAPSRINENFARELLELFLLGRDQYAEADVMEVARAWSGHNLAEDKITYRFDASAHDAGSKTIFGITTNWDGPAVITEALRGSKAVPASRHLARKLWRYLVGTVPSATVVDAISSEFRSSGLSLRALVRAILLRPEFRAADARHAIVRSPVDWFVAVAGALDITMADAHPEWFLPGMGQMPFDPPNVGGWGDNETWLSSGRWWRRADAMAYLRWVATGPMYGRFSEIAWDAAPATVADTVLRAFGIEGPSAPTRGAIVNLSTEVTAGWYGYSMRTSPLVLAALSPEFVVG